MSKRFLFNKVKKLKCKKNDKEFNLIIKRLKEMRKHKIASVGNISGHKTADKAASKED